MKLVHLLFFLLMCCFGCTNQVQEDTSIENYRKNKDGLVKQEQILLNRLSNCSNKESKKILLQLISLYDYQDRVDIPNATNNGINRCKELLNSHSLSPKERWAVLRQQAILLNEQGKQEKYLPIWYQLLEEHRAAKEIELTIEDYTTIASHFIKLGDRNQSISLYKNAYQLAKENKLFDLEKQCFTELINLLSNDARYKEVLDSCRSSNIEVLATKLSSIYSVQAKCHLRLQQPDSARFYLNKMLNTSDRQSYVSFYCRMAETYISEEKEDSATFYLDKAVTQYREQTGNNNNRLLPGIFLPIYSSYASLLQQNGKLQQAEEAFALVEPLMKETIKEPTQLNFQIDALTRYSNYYRTVGESKKALDLRVFKDSIRQVYDTLCEERDSRNEILLFQTNEIIHNNEKQQQQLVYSSRINTFYMMAILIFMGLIAVSVLIIYKLRSNNKLLRKEINTLSAPSPKATSKEKKEEPKPSAKPNSKKLKALFEQAELVVKTEELFRNSGLRKQDLAEILKTNGTYLSNCISANAHKKYNDWINGFRIDYIVERLQSTSQIETLCQEAGFSSQSVFYAAFNKKLDCTPSEYLQKKGEQESV